MKRILISSFINFRFDRLMITFAAFLRFLAVCVVFQDSGSKLIKKGKDITSPNFEAHITTTSRNFPSLSYEQGGVGSLDIFHVILLSSYHLSLTFLKEAGCKLCSSLYVDINFDADYEAAIGNSGDEFQKFTLHHLRALFSKNHIEVHGVAVERGIRGLLATNFKVLNVDKVTRMTSELVSPFPNNHTIPTGEFWYDWLS
ncbi:uncharacterized protein TNCV_3085102 [Trichonephila clavipes]|nr:uncharacterized protein TNCV_3085102 [Trichonephila clavipes]